MRVDIAVKRAATNEIWYNDAAITVTERIGMIGQTTDSVAVDTEAAMVGSAERMRRRRARWRAGYRCFTVELHRTEIDTLVHRGLLRRTSVTTKALWSMRFRNTSSELSGRQCDGEPRAAYGIRKPFATR
jgi:hypothetical protein